MFPSIIIKVGGSLFDLPDLGPRLRAWLDGLNNTGVILVPGGGPTADLVRAWDRQLDLGEEKAHWLALQALTFNANFLAAIVPGTKVIQGLEGSEIGEQGAGVGEGHIPKSLTTHHSPLTTDPQSPIPILDMYSWALADESQADHLPHCWQVTSDSLAARLAIRTRARQLTLLKLVSIPDGEDWNEAARQGWVDPYFPVVLKQASSQLLVRSINFRRSF